MQYKVYKIHVGYIYVLTHSYFVPFRKNKSSNKKGIVFVSFSLLSPAPGTEEVLSKSVVLKMTEWLYLFFIFAT